jgi:hypothetical protein
MMCANPYAPINIKNGAKVLGTPFDMINASAVCQLVIAKMIVIRAIEAVLVDIIEGKTFVSHSSMNIP